MKRQRQKYYVSLSLVLTILLLSILLPWTLSVSSAQATDETVSLHKIDNGIYDAYTDVAEHNGIHILQYAAEGHGKYAAADPETNHLIISGDDPIVHFVPRELFTTVGQDLYVGRKYGFFIDRYKLTYQKLNDATLEHETMEFEGIYATVMLFT